VSVPPRRLRSEASARTHRRGAAWARLAPPEPHEPWLCTDGHQYALTGRAVNQIRAPADRQVLRVRRCNRSGCHQPGPDRPPGHTKTPTAGWDPPRIRACRLTCTDEGFGKSRVVCSCLSVVAPSCAARDYAALPGVIGIRAASVGIGPCAVMLALTPAASVPTGQRADLPGMYLLRATCPFDGPVVNQELLPVIETARARAARRRRPSRCRPAGPMS
jgi:hypothetical protein